MTMNAPDPQAAPGQLPVIHARRTLLLGLGTTGARICGQIMERLSWNYSKLENVPWVQCVVLETADLLEGQHNLRENSTFVQLSIDSKQYAGLIQNPQNYEKDFGFQTWNIAALTQDHDSITDGANNTRLLGRLALLFPANYTRVIRALRAALAGLTSLEEKEAGVAFSRGQRQQTLVDLGGQDIYVYVAGTLCGGTSSGGFIDMGYILRSLVGYENHLKTTGIFLLPSAAHENKLHTANAYAALMELNHYSSEGSRYRQKFYDREDPVQMASGMRPYHYLYLLQARGEAEIEYAKLVTAAADYIHSDVIGGTADTRDTTRTNISAYFMQNDKYRATQKFFTFGIGSIEFPYTKVLKACSVRLARKGFQELAGGRAVTQAELNTKLADITLLPFGSLMTRLLRRPDGRIDTILQKLLAGSFESAIASNDAMDLIQGQIEAAFQGTGHSDAHRELPINIVPMTIEENARQAEIEMRAEIEKTVTSFLGVAAPHGLVSLISYLKGLQAALAAGGQEGLRALNNTEGPSLLSSIEDAQECARICREDILLAAALGKKSAVRRYVRDWLSYCTSYYSLRLRQACAPACQKVYAENLVFVEKALYRLENDTCGLAKEVHTILDKMQKLYAATNIAYGARYDGSVRVINGVELFDPATTVEEEYPRCLRATAQARNMPGDTAAIEANLAVRAVQAYFQSAQEELFADPNAVRRFDPDGSKSIPNYDDYQLLEMAHPACDAFAFLGQRSIVDRLLKRTEFPADLKKAAQASELLLNCNPSHARHQDQVNKSYKFVFFNDRDAQAAAFRQQIVQAHILDGQQGGIRFMNDQHQVMIMQERGAFSLGIISELDDEQNSTWRGDYRGSAIKSFHTRKDVTEWITWARKDDEARAYSRSVFLVGVALEIIPQVSATEYMFPYPPRRPGDPAKLSLSNDLIQACQVIKTTGVQADIEKKIAECRSENGATHIFRLIAEFVDTSSNKFLDGDKRLSAEEIWTELFDYVREDIELFKRFNARYPNTAETRYLQTNDKGKIVYVCPCDRKIVLGSRATDLYVKEMQDGTEVRLFQCAICRRAL